MSLHHGSVTMSLYDDHDEIIKSIMLYKNALFVSQENLPTFTRKKMKKLSLRELKRLSPADFKKQAKTPIVLVLDNIRSGHNVGSAFRTADAFALEKIHLCGITVQPPHREILKTAIGATEAVDWAYHASTVELIRQLKKEGIKVVAVEQADQSILLQDFQIEKNEKIALIFGNEVKGVSDEVMAEVDDCIEVPQFGTKHSLNISVCVGVVVWDLFRKIEY
ncbi:MAG: 23S rRNA (guanosine2251-2'-O)-methyltransferase [Saprospiraceae bacterium]|jgi:23S rRNA (guanosine2251-2'-O)-methyltransferase